MPEIRDILEQAYPTAVKRAALEAFEGRYETEELLTMVDQQQVISIALQLIQQ